jgi:serine/threonine-protein kinase
LPAPAAGAPALRCPACDVEVDAARLETVVGKPRFVAERSWTGVELPGMVVEQVIGAGGMGTVYRARSSQVGEGPLAVKFLSPGLAGEPELVARFWREVALLEQLDHPAIVKVKSHGERDGLPWFAMELVEGPTLAVRLAKGPLAIDEARDIFARLLGALEHAHAHGVVHRDLKPANVLLAADGARLADFGIARLDLAAATRKTQLTRTDAIIGTFPYMSPEQRAGRPVDVRSDLYSVGVMLYEALAGERPEGAFPPLHRRRPEVPARVDPVVRRLLAPEPGARFASAAETRRALAAAFAPPGLARRPLVWAAAAAVALVVGVGFLGRTTRVPVPQVAPTAKPEPRQPVVSPLPQVTPQVPKTPVEQVVPPQLPLAELKPAPLQEAMGKLGRKTGKARATKSAGKQAMADAFDQELLPDAKRPAPPRPGIPIQAKASKSLDGETAAPPVSGPKSKGGKSWPMKGNDNAFDKGKF